MTPLHDVPPRPGAPMACLGAGTGLGEAGARARAQARVTVRVEVAVKSRMLSVCHRGSSQGSGQGARASGLSRVLFYYGTKRLVTIGVYWPYKETTGMKTSKKEQAQSKLDLYFCLAIWP